VMENLPLSSDLEVWLCTIAYIVFGAILCWAIEGSAGNTDYLIDDKMSKMSLLQSVWGGTLDLWLGGPSILTAVTWPGRFCLLGYTLFIFITVSMYTANLVNFMVSAEVTPKLVNSLQEVMDTNQKLCILDAASAAIMGAFSIKEENVVRMDEQGSMTEMMFNGGCAAALLGKDDYRVYISGSKAIFTVCTDEGDEKHWATCADPEVKPEVFNLECTCSDLFKDISECRDECPYAKRYCSVQRVTDPNFAFEFTWALPINSYFNQHVSAWLSNFKTTGQVVELRNQYMIKPTPDVCSSSAGEVSPLKLKDMIGVTIIGTGIMFLGAFIAVANKISSLLCKRGAAASSDERDPMSAIPEEGAKIDPSSMSTEQYLAATTAKAKVLEAMIAALPSGSSGGSFGDRNIGASGDAGFEKDGGADASKPKPEPNGDKTDDDFLSGVSSWWQSAVVLPVSNIKVA